MKIDLNSRNPFILFLYALLFCFSTENTVHIVSGRSRPLALLKLKNLRVTFRCKLSMSILNSVLAT